MKCVNCKNCIGYQSEGYYICCIDGEHSDFIEECVANDDNQPCDAYVEDLDDDD